MGSWDSYTTGDRLRMLRADQTQEQIAEAAGCSVATIRKLERDRGSLSVPMLLRLSDALHVDTAVILGQQAPRRGADPSHRQAVKLISRAVHDISADPAPDHEPPELASLERALEVLWGAYWLGDYPQVGALLPGLLADAVALAHASPVDRDSAAWRAVADVYLVAGCVGNVVGARDMAYSAVGYAMHAAHRAHDPLATARVEKCRSWIHLRDGRLDSAQRIAERAALAVEPSYREGSPEHLSTYGATLAYAAVAASRRGDGDRACDFLAQVHAVGARLGREVSYRGAVFGPATAGAEAVSVALSLGETGRALTLIDSMPPLDGMPPAPQHRHGLSVALAQAEARMWDASLTTLMSVVTAAPDWARHQALPAVIGRKIARHSTGTLRKLGGALGVDLIAG